MYSTVLTLHSIFRWLVLLSLCYAIYRAYKGFYAKSDFSFLDNKVRHWTATIAHIQLTLGVLVYIKSPIIKYYFFDFKNLVSDWNLTFFGLFHFILMISAIVLITIGSAKAKRKKTAQEKFKTILVTYSIALLIIFIAIPWPFSPLANRPYIRAF
jgi:ABC-type Na+ efflux pump permease subunit